MLLLVLNKQVHNKLIFVINFQQRQLFHSKGDSYKMVLDIDKYLVLLIVANL